MGNVLQYIVPFTAAAKKAESLRSKPHQKTRLDTRQDSGGLLGRSNNARTAGNLEISKTNGWMDGWMDGQTYTARCRVACPRLKREKKNKKKQTIVL